MAPPASTVRWLKESRTHADHIRGVEDRRRHPERYAPTFSPPSTATLALLSSVKRGTHRRRHYDFERSVRLRQQKTIRARRGTAPQARKGALGKDGTSSPRLSTKKPGARVALRIAHF